MEDYIFFTSVGLGIVLVKTSGYNQKCEYFKNIPLPLFFFGLPLSLFELYDLVHRH